MGATCNTCSTNVDDLGEEYNEQVMRSSENILSPGNLNLLNDNPSLYRVVRIQSNIRMFLAKRRFFRLKDNPLVYALVITPTEGMRSKFIKMKRADLDQEACSYLSNAVK